jgi:hypothetical protein
VARKRAGIWGFGDEEGNFLTDGRDHGRLRRGMGEFKRERGEGESDFAATGLLF